MKTEPPIWIAAEFEIKNSPVDDAQRKTLCINKPVAIGYNIDEKPIEMT